MLELARDALVVFVSDCHIGGDPGCDGFESPDELEALLVELAGREGPVELVLAGDFFDFLQIGGVPRGENRASVTMARPEYRKMFEALRDFRSESGKRVIYLPGNHDAEAWWNSEVQETLRERGLVDEFAFSYLTSMEVERGRRIVYCEHGNQFDPENIVEDYADRLDTPLGHHVVTDFTRRIAPFGEVAKGLNLSEIKMVYPLVAIPQWIASRYFYHFVGKVVSYLLLPLFILYALYRTAAYFLALYAGNTAGFSQSYQELPGVHWLFVEIAGFAALSLLIFGVFFLVLRHSVHRTLAAMSLGHKRPHYDPAEASREKIEAILAGGRLPMSPFDRPEEIDAFVSGHTHLPFLAEMERKDGERRVVVNSGCWLRQLQPVRARLKSPPVFVSKFVLTHVRICARGDELQVELWERPKPAEQNLTWIERLLSRGRLPTEPSPASAPRVRASRAV